MDIEVVKRLQTEQKEIMDEIVRICDKHGLTYFLLGGTLLGAVRHKGFIPWDDDIDMGMPRRDYDRFKELCKTELGSAYFLQDYDTDPYYHMPYINMLKKDTILVQKAKMYSEMKCYINVDIFPLNDTREESPNSPRFKRRYKKFARANTQIYYEHLYKPRGSNEGGIWLRRKGLGFYLYLLYSKLVGLDAVKEKREQLIREQDGENSQSTAIFGTPSGIVKDFHKKSTFFPVAKLEFEGTEYTVPGDYHTYLTQLYGKNYMRIPAQSDRMLHEDLLVSFGREEGMVPEEKLRLPKFLRDEDIRRIQLVQLEMLDELHRLCEKHGIRYYLCGGTLLGAVRHKGCIPWDDDIDVSMPRADYDLFKEVCKNELKPGIFYQDEETDPEYVNYFARLRKNGTLMALNYYRHEKMHKGIFLDIFPLDDSRTNNGLGLRMRHRLFMGLHHRIRENTFPPSRRIPGYSPGYYLTVLLDKLLGGQKGLISFRGKLARRDNGKGGEYYTVVGTHHGTGKETVHKSVYDPPGKLMFEGKEYWVPRQWRVYLTKLFGINYMQQPPPSKCMQHKLLQVIIDENEGDVILDNPPMKVNRKEMYPPRWTEEDHASGQ